MSQESRKGYLKRVFRQAKTDSDFLSVKKSIGSIGFGVLRSLFHRDATTVRDFLVGIVLPALAAYAVLCAGELAWNIVRAPFTLDRQRANELNSRDHEIAKLNKQLAAPLLVKFREVVFLNNRMLVRMSISTGESPATLSGWALRSQMTPTLTPVLADVNGLGKHVGGFAIRLDDHDLGEGHLTFSVPGLAEDELRDVRHQWTLEFSDAHREHSERIPEHLYQRPS